ncbi:hypothetical protein SAMN04489806_2908 [Paramicrobacterium humi]|uniref:PH domain-containing protein n=1 Tax=Paramicrobacterium humi TaxID=640635 RepID=A0A1H4QSW3_9MICO|nr:hypothetical protein [Microbacterium humi]SEC22750.1 hypothetical protein SAMN04489806_2908 [Microbacterium humi]
MDKVIPGLIVAAIVVVIFAAMWAGWRRRTRRDAGHAPASVPADFAVLEEYETLYVATTERDAPLERLAVPGLAYRAAARLLIGSNGLALEIPGERTTFLPARQLRGIRTAQMTIDRVVEADGLLLLAWTLPDGTDCDSYLRVRDGSEQPAVIDAITNLIPTYPADSAAESENNV